jgi:hypothetical protein
MTEGRNHTRTTTKGHPQWRGSRRAVLLPGRLRPPLREIPEGSPPDAAC